jgi:hypothetical protein
MAQDSPTAGLSDGEGDGISEAGIQFLVMGPYFRRGAGPIPERVIPRGNWELQPYRFVGKIVVGGN